MNAKQLLAGAVLVSALAACASPTKPATRTQVTQASNVTLANTHWRLTQLGGEVVNNPADAGDVHFKLQPSSTNVVGFSGCNRMFGRYALDGASLKFDAMGGTRMACEGRMELEGRFLNAFASVSAWKITNDVLVLSDADGKPVATFQASTEPALATPAG